MPDAALEQLAYNVNGEQLATSSEPSRPLQGCIILETFVSLSGVLEAGALGFSEISASAV